jgi:hypothetical protein
MRKDSQISSPCDESMLILSKKIDDRRGTPFKLAAELEKELFALGGRVVYGVASFRGRRRHL